MDEEKLNNIIKKILDTWDIKVEKLEYVMDFGEVSAQYDFNLN